MNVVLLAIGGQNAVSVYGILMTMDGFVHPLLYGMCDSLQPAVGFNWGARNIKRVKAIELRCYTAAITLALATTAAVLMLMLPPFSITLVTSANTFLGRRSRMTETLNTFVPNSSVIAVLISSQPFPFP